VDRNTGCEVGRYLGQENGPPMIERRGGSAGLIHLINLIPDTHTYYPNGSNYQRLDPLGHGPGSPPHCDGHQGSGPGKKGQGPSIDPHGNVVPWNSPGAHLPIR
jgi:hypothetical protein